MTTISMVRRQFHETVCQHAVFYKKNNAPSIADTGSRLSTKLSQSIFEQIGIPLARQKITPQSAGKEFEQAIRIFLQESFSLLDHLRPAKWHFSVQGNIADFEQYQHIAELNRLIEQNQQIQSALGDYLIKPDVVVSRSVLSDEEINQRQHIVSPHSYPQYSPLRQTNSSDPKPILHASISCKLTLRSDRSQNARTEGLNLIRNRKGHTPHIAVVTAEPMPSRLASLALGTGDIDCVYHFSLHELMKAVESIKEESAIDALNIMVEGKRLRDISDLPFDLVA